MVSEGPCDDGFEGTFDERLHQTVRRIIAPGTFALRAAHCCIFADRSVLSVAGVGPQKPEAQQGARAVQAGVQLQQGFIPDFPLGPYAEENMGVKRTGKEKVLERSQRPSIHSLWCMAMASFRMSLRPSVVV